MALESAGETKIETKSDEMNVRHVGLVRIE